MDSNRLLGSRLRSLKTKESKTAKNSDTVINIEWSINQGIIKSMGSRVASES